MKLSFGNIAMNNVARFILSLVCCLLSVTVSAYSFPTFAGMPTNDPTWLPVGNPTTPATPAFAKTSPVAMQSPVTAQSATAMAAPVAPKPVAVPILLQVSEVDSAALSHCTHDSIFLANSRPVIFNVNKTFLHEADKIWLRDTIKPVLDSLGSRGIILVRATASPEGPVPNNERLAKGRRDAAMKFLIDNGVDVSRFHIEVVTEDYELLLEMMRQKHDPAYETVLAAYNKLGRNYAALKTRLMAVDQGRMWRRLLKEYFPELRAVRMMLIDVTTTPEEPVVEPVEEPIVEIDTVPVRQIIETGAERVFEEEPIDSVIPRREVWNIKTNLLEWGAYVPQYGYCPMPNVTLEYYPLRGHFTYTASFDCPWWDGNTVDHDYFQLRNYTLETRYYFRSGDVRKVGIGNGHAYQKFYVGAYAHAFLYGIGLSKWKGWQGEGLGAGVSMGYVLPIGKSRWSLDFSAQFGFFRTGYDPYIYGIPILDGAEDGLYYYNWKHDSELFKLRQYRFNWLGPTRVSVTLNYDILYRPTKGKKKGLSFKRWEPWKKGGSK